MTPASLVVLCCLSLSLIKPLTNVQYCFMSQNSSWLMYWHLVHIINSSVSIVSCFIGQQLIETDQSKWLCSMVINRGLDFNFLKPINVNKSLMQPLNVNDPSLSRSIFPAYSFLDSIINYLFLPVYLSLILSSSRTSVPVKQGLFNAKIHNENGRYIHRLIYEFNEQDLLGHSR